MNQVVNSHRPLYIILLLIIFMQKSETLLHIFFKCCIGFVLSNCANEKSVYMLSYAIKLFECQKNAFGIRNTQYIIALSVHKQPSVFNTTYMIQSRMNCPNVLPINRTMLVYYY